MAERVFLDTNILVYADDLDSEPKCSIACDLLKQALVQGSGVISTQVLQEFFVTATKKLKIPPDIARRKVELIASMDVVRVDERLILEAIDIHRLHQFSFWDALIVSCAMAGGASTLMTEDMQHDRVIGGVRIQNPFRS